MAALVHTKAGVDTSLIFTRALCPCWYEPGSSGYCIATQEKQTLGYFRKKGQFHGRSFFGMVVIVYRTQWRAVFSGLFYARMIP